MFHIANRTRCASSEKQIVDGQIDGHFQCVTIVCGKTVCKRCPVEETVNGGIVVRRKWPETRIKTSLNVVFDLLILLCVFDGWLNLSWL